MRVLVVSQYYDPEPIPKPSELAEELQRRGHDVYVITGLPNYPTGVMRPGYRLTGWLAERIRRVPVLRVFEIPYHGSWALGRVANYASFMVAAVVGGLFVPRPDVIYVWHPPLTVGLAAWAIGAMRRAPFVFDVQDIWPDEVIMSGLMRDGFVADMLRVLEKFVYRHAGAILVVTPGARANLAAKGVPEAKISIIPNWLFGPPPEPPSADEVRAARTELGANGGFVLTFAGNLGVLQDLDTVLMAAEALRSRPDISIRIIGDGSERRRLERLAGSKALENVTFLGPRPARAMPALLAASDALLVHLDAGHLTDLILPTKTIAYMAAGRPVLMAMRGAAAELIDRAGAGVIVPGGDSAALAEATARLADLPADERDAMGQRGRAVALAEFERGHVVDELEALFMAIARG